jgi:hypothetical protein
MMDVTDYLRVVHPVIVRIATEPASHLQHTWAI